MDPSSHPQVHKIVLQPTPYCNLRCSYCYLPDRANRARMSAELPAQVLRYLISSNIASAEMLILWHAGEPLAAGIQFYREAIDKMEAELSLAHKITHTIQTNATLINDEWCQLFKEKKFHVGVSLDGPKFLTDKHRLFQSKKGSFDLIMRGIKLLKQYEIPFFVIAVITTASLDYPDEIYTFFEELGAESLGFNVEEDLGINRSKTIHERDFTLRYKAFFKQIYARAKTGKLIIREVERVFTSAHGSSGWINDMATPLYFLNVDYQGNFSTFSPELLGMSDERYGSFVFGNILTTPIEEVLSSKKFLEVCEKIEEGVHACKDSCEYFFACKGGSPANKLYGNGSFTTTETLDCISRVKIPMEIIHPDLLVPTKLD